VLSTLYLKMRKREQSLVPGPKRVKIFAYSTHAKYINESYLLGKKYINSIFDTPEDDFTTFCRNVGNRLSTDVSLCPRRTRSLTKPLRKPPKTCKYNPVYNSFGWNIILLSLAFSAVILPLIHYCSPQGVQNCVQHMLLMAAKFTPWLCATQSVHNYSYDPSEIHCHKRERELNQRLDDKFTNWRIAKVVYKRVKM